MQTLFIISQEKILHTRRPKLSFSREHGILCESYQLFAVLRCSGKMENKEYHHGGFQQQNTQRFVDIYEHMNSRNDRQCLRLKAMPMAQFFVQYSIQQSNTMYIHQYSVPVRFIRQEWSVAPSIFNIKARGLAHCLYQLKLSLDKVYEVYFHAIQTVSNGRACKK